MASGRGASSRWFFTREQLENTPSRRCGVEADKELSYRQQAANLIQEMGQRLNVYPFPSRGPTALTPWSRLPGGRAYCPTNMAAEPPLPSRSLGRKRFGVRCPWGAGGGGEEEGKSGREPALCNPCVAARGAAGYSSAVAIGE